MAFHEIEIKQNEHETTYHTIFFTTNAYITKAIF